MAELLPVPEVAAGSTEVLLSEWTIDVGQGVTRGDVIAVVETDKAVVEVEADRDATVLRLLATAGSSIAVGAPLALLGTEEEIDADLDAILAELGVGDATATPAPDRRDVPEAAEPEAAEPEPPALQADEPEAAEPAAAESGTAEPEPTAQPSGPGTRRFVSPIARKLLADAGLSSDSIEGTGPGGRIRRRDVEPVIRAARESAESRPHPRHPRPRHPRPLPNRPLPLLRASRTRVPGPTYRTRACGAPWRDGSPRASSWCRTSTYAGRCVSTRCSHCEPRSTRPHR